MSLGSYRTYLLLVLSIALAFTNTDRQVLSLAMQGIKTDLHFSDAQLGLLAGLAFAVFNSLLGIPLARLADRGDRVALIAVTTLLSGIAIALCGFAMTFTQFVLVRVAVAIGEAGLIPAANSLIPDYFEPSERPRAFGIFFIGGPMSLVVGYLVGGQLIDGLGWRWAFVAFGLPAVCVSCLVWLTLRDPSRRQPDVAAFIGRESGHSSKLLDVVKALWRNRTFRNLTYANVIFSVANYGTVQWLPVFFQRSYQLTTSEMGRALALASGLGGILGLYAGGKLVHSVARTTVRHQVLIVAGSYVSTGLLLTMVCLANTPALGFVMLGLAYLLGAVGTAPVYAIQLGIVPPRMRAQSVAIQLLVANLVGAGLGPTVAGGASDLLTPWLGNSALRWTLVSFFPGYLWAAWHVVCASRTVVADLARQGLEESEGATAVSKLDAWSLR